MSMTNASNVPALPEKIRGVADIVGQYDAFILDIWGVLHNGVAAFTGTVPALETLRRTGKQVLLLSNTPALHSDTEGQLARFGIRRDLYDFIVTAGDSARDELTQWRGRSCWYASDEFALAMTQGLDLTLLDGPEGAEVIINAMHGITGAARAQFLEQLKTAKKYDLPMICTNPDLVVHVGEQLLECPGAFAKFYEEIGGVVSYHGKPHPPIYERAWDLLGKPDKRRVVAIGDALHTDMQGAHRFGIDGVLNLGGIHRDEADDSGRWLDGQAHRPTMVMSGFQ